MKTALRQIQRLNLGDYDRLIGLLNRAYGFGDAEGFGRLVPLLCRPDEDAMQRYFAVSVDGQISAVAGLFPIQWRIGGTTLRVAGVGSVAVAPEHRGKGLMHQLLRHVEQEIRDGRYHLSYLSGQRQRYRKYGWEAAGTHLCAELNGANVRSLDPDGEAVTLAAVGEPADFIEQIKALHDRRATACVRDLDDFTLRLRNWFARLVVAKDRHGRVVGYAVTDQAGKHAWEVVGEDDASTSRIIQALATPHPLRSGLMLHADVGNAAMCRQLAATAEYVTASASGNWQVLDWPAVVGAMLSLKHRAYGLPPGAVVLGIEGQAAPLRLSVDHDGARCCLSDREADITADAPTATRLLFGPLPADIAAAVPPGAAVLRSWCPLPLDLPQLDRV